MVADACVETAPADRQNFASLRATGWFFVQPDGFVPLTCCLPIIYNFPLFTLENLVNLG